MRWQSRLSRKPKRLTRDPTRFSNTTNPLDFAPRNSRAVQTKATELHRGTQTMKIFAQPALAGAGNWNVTESGAPHLAFVDFATLTMSIPTYDDPHSRFVRAHEVMHARITPRDGVIPEGTSADSLRAAEDCRVNANLLRIEIKAPGPRDKFVAMHLDAIKANADRATAFDLACLAVACTDRGEKRTLDNLIKARFPAIAPTIAMLRKALRAYDAPFRTTIEAARILERLRPPAATIAGNEIPQAENAAANQGLFFTPIRYEEMSLTQRVEELQHQRRILSDTGIVPKHFHRAAIDGAIFSRNVRRPGANALVVLDCSGSMTEWNRVAIPDILRDAGATEIVGYTSRNGWTAASAHTVFSHFSDGTNCLDVSAGMPAPFHTGGNTGDGPILEVCAALAQRQGKRLIWVSDGHVMAKDSPNFERASTVDALRYCEAVLASVNGIRIDPDTLAAHLNKETGDLEFIDLAPLMETILSS